MEHKSEYFSALSAASRARYERKVIAAGLTTDPYCIEQWHEDLDSFPEVNWSDMIVYLTATPSENTREAMKVLVFCQKRLAQSVIENRLGREWLMEVALCEQGGFTSSDYTRTQSLKETDSLLWGKYINLFCKYGLLTICLGQAFTTNFSGVFTAMGNCEKDWRSVGCSLYLYGWVSIIVQNRISGR